MKSAEQFVLHGVTCCLCEENLIIRSASKIGIDEFKTREILKEMLEGNYFTKDKTTYTPTDIYINIKSLPNLLPNQMGVSSIVNGYIQKEGDYQPPYTMAQNFSFDPDEENLALFSESYRKLISSVPKFGVSFSRADYIMLFNSNYISVPSMDDSVRTLEFPSVSVLS